MNPTTCLLLLGALGAGSSDAPLTRVDPSPAPSWLVVSELGTVRLLERGLRGEARDVTLEAGLDGVTGVRSCAWLDVDHDGTRDLAFLGVGGGLVFYRKAGTEGFLPLETNLDGWSWSDADSLDVLDFDGDGRPDLVLGRPERLPVLLRSHSPGSFDVHVLDPLDGAPWVVGEPVEQDPGEEVRGRVPEDRRARAERSGQAGLASAGEVPCEVRTGSLSTCADSIQDAAGGGCLTVDSQGGVQDTLYPLGSEFNVDAQGNVGIGTLSPQERLHVSGGKVRVEDSVEVRASGSELTRMSANTGSMVFINPSNLFAGEVGVHNLGAGFVTLQDPAFTSLVLDGNSGGGGALRVWGDAVETARFEGDGLGGGAFEMRNDQGDVTVDMGHSGGSNLFIGRFFMDDESIGAGGLIALSTLAGSPAFWIGGMGSTSGGGVDDAGTISIRDNGLRAIELLGDSGLGSDCNGNQAACLDLYDLGIGGHPTLTASARDAAGTGAEMLLRDADGTVTVDLDGQNGSLGQLALREADGSLAFQLLGNTLRLYDANGSVTQSYDRITGAKSAVLQTEHHGLREVYMVESPGVWLEDFGGGQLREGERRVDLDPVFLETVTVDELTPLEIQVTLHGPSPGVWVEKGRDHFVVHELDGGSGEVSFDWRAMARRRGLESLRLEPHVEEAGQASAVLDPEPAGR